MIIVFDSMCNVCNGYIRFLSARDRDRRLSFIPAASERGRLLLGAHGESPDDPSTMLVIDGDRVRKRSDAVLAAIVGLGGWWRGARLFLLAPRRLRDLLYSGFARRRYRWFGRASDCVTCRDVGTSNRR